MAATAAGVVVTGDGIAAEGRGEGERVREGFVAVDRVPANCAFTTSLFVMMPCFAVPTSCADERPADAILCLAAGENRWVGEGREDDTGVTAAATASAAGATPVGAVA